MNALSGGRSKRHFRISEHHPRWTSNRTFCVAPEPVWLHLGHGYRHFRSKTLAPFLLRILKGHCPADIPGNPKARRNILFRATQAMKLEGPRQLLLAQLASLPSSTHLMAERLSLSDAVGPDFSWLL